MRLRKLEEKDAFLMLEWMHDKNITAFLNKDFSRCSIEDANLFIRASGDESVDIHRAIVSDTDEYMGTVSLKNSNVKEGHAEFAITLRSVAMHRGYAWFGMREILKYGFDIMHLDSIYWCVSEKNARAIRFYEKHNFHETLDIAEKFLEQYNNSNEYRWFSVLKGDDYLGESIKRKSIANCDIIKINTISTVDAGEISFFEGMKDFSFDIKRLYYITKVPEGMRRGFHAHKNLKQLLFCPYGSIQLILEDKEKKEEIVLSDPSLGILIDHTVWREMLWLEKDSVLCVAASDYYDAADYIRDYNLFREYVGKEKLE